MADKNGPRLIVENTDAQIATQRATERISRALVELTANLLRIARGAGKPYEISRHIDEFSGAVDDYHEVSGSWPLLSELTKALEWKADHQWLLQFSNSERGRIYAKERIVSGALQVAASKLLGQKTQESAGESEIEQGIKDLEAIRAFDRRERLAALRAEKTKPKRRGKPASDWPT